MPDAIPLLQAARAALRHGESLVKKDESRDTLARLGKEMEAVLVAETSQTSLSVMSKEEQAERVVAAFNEMHPLSENDGKRLKAVVLFSLKNTIT
jgi:hypothetical protein